MKDFVNLQSATCKTYLVLQDSASPHGSMNRWVMVTFLGKPVKLMKAMLS